MTTRASEPNDTDPPLDWSNARQYRKKVAVKAVQIREPRVWTTERGDELRGEPGDWLLSDSRSSWTVAGSVFEATYRPTGDGRWVKVATIGAVRVEVPTSCATLEGRATALAGDYVARNPTGEVWPIPAEVFERTYAPATD